jgi:prefoldin subunit 5
MTAQRTIARLRNEVAEMNEKIADLEQENRELTKRAKKYTDLCEVLRTPGLSIQVGRRL